MLWLFFVIALRTIYASVGTMQRGEEWLSFFMDDMQNRKEFFFTALTSNSWNLEIFREINNHL